MSKKKVIFILGMHRSGTSALAGALHYCGIAGGTLLMEPAFDNEKGFFENQTAVRINEAILSDWGLSWESPFLLSPNWADDSLMRKHQQAIGHFLEVELSNTPTLYLKDPRLCLLLPAWQPVLERQGIEAIYLHVFRHPAEVAASLLRRNEMPNNLALSLWANHHLLAEYHTRHGSRIFVGYEDLLQAPAQVVETLLSKLQVATEGASQQGVSDKLQDFIEQKLRHHQAVDPAAYLGKVPFVGEILAFLQGLKNSPYEPSILAGLDEARLSFQSHLSFFYPLKQTRQYASLELRGEMNRKFAPVKIPVYEGLDELVFQLGKLPVGHGLRVYPCNEPCEVTLGQITLYYLDGSRAVSHPTVKKIAIEHGDELLFGNTDFLEITPLAGKVPIQLSLQMRYNGIGSGAVEQMHVVGEGIKNWLYGSLAEKDAKYAQDAQAWEQKWRELQGAAAVLKAEAGAREQDFLLQKKLLDQQVQLLQDEVAATVQISETRAQQLAQQAFQLQAKTEQLEELARQSAVQSQAFAEQLRQAEAQRATLTDELQAANTRAAALHAKTEEGQRLVLALQEKNKEKERLIWDLHAKGQKSEDRYQNSLRLLDDIRCSISYRVGWMLTGPLRFVFDMASSKPANETQIWLWWQFLYAGLSMPGKLLSHTNQKNIQTLRMALKRESPRQIAGNLIKLLTSPNQPRPSPAAPAPVEAVPTPPVASPVAVVPGPALKKTVIFCSPHLPDFDTSSGGKRATRLLELLAEEYEVFAFTLGEKPARHVQKLESAGVRVFRGNDFEEMKRLVPQADAIIFSFFYMYFDCGRFLQLYPAAKVVVDSVDVHWVRHERSRGLWPGLTDDIIEQKKALEIEVYGQADIVWAVTEQDRQAILREVPGADVRIVSNIHAPERSSYSDPGNHNLLFFGGFAHYPNLIAVRELALSIFPKIKAQVPEARLVIAGANAPQDVEDLGKLPGIEFLGFIEEGQVAALYESSFLALAPLQAGAGIKGKICEAIAHRLPVVTNSIGNEGINLVSGESGLVSDDPDELVRLTVSALRREFDFEKMTLLAQERLQDLVGPGTVKRNMLASLGGNGAMASFSAPASKEVSICIVTWNRMGLLQRCIESIEAYTQGVPHKILVWSNGCTDGTRGYLEAAAKINPNIVPILSPSNEVFVIPNNRMMQMFPANDVVLLNNDTYVTAGWLAALRNAAYASEDVGIVGAKLLYPDGRLQEFGSELYANGTGRNIGKYDDPHLEAYSEPRYVGYVSGCVFYVKRAVIERIGTFDEAFHPCYCEDSDYCYTAWEQGISTLVTPDCVVYHDEGATSGTDTNTGAKVYQKVNFEKFLAKHGGRLEETGTRVKLKNLSLK